MLREEILTTKQAEEWDAKKMKKKAVRGRGWQNKKKSVNLSLRYWFNVQQVLLGDLGINLTVVLIRDQEEGQEYREFLGNE
jgi:hypothetical protein